MDPNRLLVVIVGVELFTLTLLWIIARAGAHRVRRRHVECPRDGRRAHLLVDETAGRALAGSDVIRCSLVDSDPARTCDRECGSRLPTPHARKRRRRWLGRSVVVLGALAFVPLVHGAGADEDMSGRRELQMSHCPSAVGGASTRVANIDGGVTVTVRAPLDPVAQTEIRRRVQYQLEVVDRPERGAIEHTGLGTGSGRYGFCPGMMERTSISVEWTTDGAKMIIRADRPENVRRLQTTTRRRARVLGEKLRRTAAR